MQPALTSPPGPSLGAARALAAPAQFEMPAPNRKTTFTPSATTLPPTAIVVGTPLKMMLGMSVTNGGDGGGDGGSDGRGLTGEGGGCVGGAGGDEVGGGSGGGCAGGGGGEVGGGVVGGGQGGTAGGGSGGGKITKVEKIVSLAIRAAPTARQLTPTATCTYHSFDAMRRIFLLLLCSTSESSGISGSR